MYFYIFSYLNDISILTMDQMSKESLEIFLESRIFGNYVSTDFSSDIANKGDTVIAHYPVEMESDRLAENATMSLTNVAAASHSITLNQHLYVAVPFTHREMIRSEVDLVNYYFAPMARSLAKQYDRILQGEIYHSHLYTVGAIGSSLTNDNVVDAGTLQTLQNVPIDGRNMIIGPTQGGQIRKASSFVDKLSLTDASLIRTGVIGQLGGYVVSETNSFATVANSTENVEALLAADADVGDATVTVDTITGTFAAGFWCKIGGIPYRSTAKTDDTGNLVTITVEGGIRVGALNNAVVTIYEYPLVNLVAGYGAGYEGAIAYDGGITPKVGQGVTFGTTGRPYSIVKVTSTTITLNRPLDAAIANDAPIFLMPGGNYGVALSRSSIQVVTRPMPSPQGGGVIASTAVGENFAIKVTKGYVQLEAKEIITMEAIMGVANHFPAYNVLFLG